MDLPDLRFQLQRFQEEADGLFGSALIACDQAHFVINFGVFRVARQRFLEGIHRGFELLVRVMAETEHAVSLGIIEVHA